VKTFRQFIGEAMLGGKKYRGKSNPNSSSRDATSLKSAEKFHAKIAAGHATTSDKQNNLYWNNMDRAHMSSGDRKNIYINRAIKNSKKEVKHDHKAKRHNQAAQAASYLRRED
jgi:hypothetical protein